LTHEEWLAERLNDAWAVVRCVSHREGNEAMIRHDRPIHVEEDQPTRGIMDGLADDLLEAAALIRAGDATRRELRHRG
jgi:hypothetical protein